MGQCSTLPAHGNAGDMRDGSDRMADGSLDGSSNQSDPMMAEKVGMPPLSPRSAMKQRRQAGYQPVGTGSTSTGDQQAQAQQQLQQMVPVPAAADARDDNSSRGGMREQQQAAAAAADRHMVNAVKNSVQAMDPFLSNNNNGQPPQQQQQQPTPQHQQHNHPGSGYPPTSPRSGNAASAADPNAMQGVVVQEDPASSTRRDDVPVAKPPENAVRARCYRLNLELPPSLPAVDPSSGRQFVGPLVYEPPPHHLPRSLSYTGMNRVGNNRRRIHSWGQGASGGMNSLVGNNNNATSPTGSTTRDGAISPPDDASVQSQDSSSKTSATQVAISTARIFRGITVDGNGTILSQNARATRSSRRQGAAGAGDKKKVGEKSRQAAKIDKAKDLVEEAAMGGGKDDGDAPNMVSLVIMGEYDHMKHLVRDGSKKLREAEGLPDEALLALNRPRLTSPGASPGGSQAGGASGSQASHRGQSQGGGGGGSFNGTPPVSPGGSARKRTSAVSPHGGRSGDYGGSPKSKNPRSPSQAASSQQQPTTPYGSQQGQGQATPGSGSAPPKLKAHPRDAVTSGSTRSRRSMVADAAAAQANQTQGGNRDNSDESNRRAFAFPGSQYSPAAHCSDGSTPWEALGLHSIWNCGANGRTSTTSGGTMSPTNANNGNGGGGGAFDAAGGAAPSQQQQAQQQGAQQQVRSPVKSPQHHQQGPPASPYRQQGYHQQQAVQQQYHPYDERNEMNSYARGGGGGGGRDERMDAPVYA